MKKLHKQPEVEPTGIEPMTSRTSSGRSSQLSYDRISSELFVSLNICYYTRLNQKSKNFLYQDFIAGKRTESYNLYSIVFYVGAAV